MLANEGCSGLKNYIATENIGITTSAGLVRNLFGRSIQLGRQYARSHNKADLYEALRLLGTGCHCLEDYSAHSNYTELALIELGERGVFPHVGRRTMMNLPGIRQQVYPIITGTFGGVDFLHSVMVNIYNLVGSMLLIVARANSRTRLHNPKSRSSKVLWRTVAKVATRACCKIS